MLRTEQSEVRLVAGEEFKRFQFLKQRQILLVEAGRIKVLQLWLMGIERKVGVINQLLDFIMLLVFNRFDKFSVDCFPGFRMCSIDDFEDISEEYISEGIDIFQCFIRNLKYLFMEWRQG